MENSVMNTLNPWLSAILSLEIMDFNFHSELFNFLSYTNLTDENDDANLHGKRACICVMTTNGERRTAETAGKEVSTGHV
jgi:hypothetical protein